MPASALITTANATCAAGAPATADNSPMPITGLIQHTGFLDSITAIRGVAVEYKQPICMMIGLLQHDPEKAPKESPRYGVRIVEPILDDMGIAHHLLSVDADIAKIKPAIDKAYAESQPVAFLVGRSPKVS